MNCIGAEVPNPNMLLFIDESAKDERTSFRKYGRAAKGTPCIQRQCFIRGIRYTILPVLTLDGIIAYDIIEGSVTGERFIQFLKDHVVRRLIQCYVNKAHLLNFIDAIHYTIPGSSKCPGHGQLQHSSW